MSYKAKSETPQQVQQQKEEEALTPKGRFDIYTPIRISSEYDDKTYVEYMMNSLSLVPSLLRWNAYIYSNNTLHLGRGVTRRV